MDTDVMLNENLKEFTIEQLQQEITFRKKKYPKLITQSNFNYSSNSLYNNLSTIIKNYYSVEDKNINELKNNIADRTLISLFTKEELNKLLKL